MLFSQASNVSSDSTSSAVSTALTTIHRTSLLNVLICIQLRARHISQASFDPVTFGAVTVSSHAYIPLILIAEMLLMCCTDDRDCLCDIHEEIGIAQAQEAAEKALDRWYRIVSEVPLHCC